MRKADPKTQIVLNRIGGLALFCIFNAADADILHENLGLEKPFIFLEPVIAKGHPSGADRHKITVLVGKGKLRVIDVFKTEIGHDDKFIINVVRWKRNAGESEPNDDGGI